MIHVSPGLAREWRDVFGEGRDLWRLGGTYEHRPPVEHKVGIFEPLRPDEVPPVKAQYPEGGFGGDIQLFKIDWPAIFWDRFVRDRREYFGEDANSEDVRVGDRTVHRLEAVVHRYNQNVDRFHSLRKKLNSAFQDKTLNARQFIGLEFGFLRPALSFFHRAAGLANVAVARPPKTPTPAKMIKLCDMIDAQLDLKDRQLDALNKKLSG